MSQIVDRGEDPGRYYRGMLRVPRRPLDPENGKISEQGTRIADFRTKKQNFEIVLCRRFAGYANSMYNSAPGRAYW